MTLEIDKVIALDLEMNQPSGAIIQIGAAVGSMKSGRVIETFSVLTRAPEPLNPEIEKLTGITQAALDECGVALAQGYEQLLAFVRQHKPFINPLTWGGGDSQELREQLRMNDERWCFGRRWIDVKTLHVVSCLAAGIHPAGGLKSTMRKHYKMNFEGRAHDAKDDAVNTFRLFCKIVGKHFSPPEF